MAPTLGLAVLLGGCTGQATLTLATTTSTYDSGLLDVILPPFENENNVTVKVVALGTGQALALGRNGDADVLLVHAPDQEEEFVAQGYGVERREVMYNDFIILGPPQDPAGVRRMGDAAQALARIAQARATFVSRGDGSGTHVKEKALWARAGITPGPEEGWYLSTGQGMGETLTLAHEKGAYTLSDRATYLSRRTGLDLGLLVEGDPLLLNPYHVMAVNPQKHPHIKYDLAVKLIDYLTSNETQKAIGEYTRDGQALFHPSSAQWKAGQGR